MFFFFDSFMSSSHWFNECFSFLILLCPLGWGCVTLLLCRLSGRRVRWRRCRPWTRSGRMSRRVWGRWGRTTSAPSTPRLTRWSDLSSRTQSLGSKPDLMWGKGTLLTFFHDLGPMASFMQDMQGELQMGCLVSKCLVWKSGVIVYILFLRKAYLIKLLHIKNNWINQNLIITIFKGWCLWWPLPLHPRLVAWECADRRAVLTNVRPGDIQGGLAYVRQVSKFISEKLSWHYFYTFIDRVTKQNGENGIQCSGNN